MRSSIKLPFLLLFLSACLFAQTVSPCREHALVVSALDGQRVPVKNLTGADFRASYRGQPATVSSFQYRQNPSGRVVVLLDVSGSMRGGNTSNKWKIAHTMASEFISSAFPRTQVSFTSFASTVQQRFEASGGRQPIQEWLASSSVREGEQLKGRTALYETILSAINELSPAEPGDAIYVITDGGDNSSNTKTSLVERSLLNSGIRLFAFLLYENTPAMETQLGPPELDDLVRRSGGLLATLNAHTHGFGGELYQYDEKVVKAMQSTTRTIQAQMSNFYVLTIEGIDSSAKQKDLNLDVVDAKGRKRKDVTVAYQHRPVICSQ